MVGERNFILLKELIRPLRIEKRMRAQSGFPLIGRTPMCRQASKTASSRRFPHSQKREVTSLHDFNESGMNGSWFVIRNLNLAWLWYLICPSWGGRRVMLANTARKFG